MPHQSFKLIILPPTCFEHPRVHHQEDLYMQFYIISFMHPYRQPGRWQDVLDVLVLITQVYHNARFKKT